MVYNEYSTDNYRFSKINIGAVIKNPEMLNCAPDYLKTKIMGVSMQLKKFTFPVRHVSDQYKTQQMCDKGILENGGTLESARGCYKN